MPIHRWDDEPIEELTPLIGRQVVHTETMTIARIHLKAGATFRPMRMRTSRLRPCSRAGCGSSSAARSTRWERESMFVPGDVPHEVEALEGSLVLDVFSPVRDDWVRGEDLYLRG